MNRTLLLVFLLAPSSLLAAGSASAEVKLAAIFSDHAVLQRGHALPVWGTAAPGEAIEVKFAGQTVQATADPSGQWRVELKSLPAGGPFEMVVTGPNQIVVHDILVGEVWLASGQSNMAFPLSGVVHAADEIASAGHPQLRVFTEPDRPLADPTQELQGQWEVSTAASAKHFTAVGYFFGLSLLNDLNVPVGIISASVGATPGEAWTPLPAMLADPLLSARATSEIKQLREADDPAHVATALAAWEKTYGAGDPGNAGFAHGYASPAAKLEGWKTVTLPTTGRKLGITGAAAVWVRREITLPEGKYEQTGHLDPGQLHEADTVYFNGVKVGGAAPGPEPFDRAISYNVPATLLRAGKNTIAIRVFAHQPAKLGLGSGAMALTIPQGNAKPLQLPLSGEWSFAVELQKPLTEEAMKAQPQMPQFRPTKISSTLYNGEIAPLENYAIRGAIWYQGEDNVDRAATYPALMTRLIGGWRAQFGEDFPFYLAQLVNYDGGRHNWANLREAQVEIVKTVPKTGLAVGIDIGETDQIHPRNKRPMGERLALLARHRVYGEKIEDTGPTFASIKIEKDKVRVQLTHADGLHATGGTIPCFAVAGADQKFVAATAAIDGTTVIVSSPNVIAPVAVQYAFSQDPEGCDVYNGADLPMGPFRSDEWPVMVSR